MGQAPGDAPQTLQHGQRPAGTRRNDGVCAASERRRRRRFDVVGTLSSRHCCVVCPWGGVGWPDVGIVGLALARPTFRFETNSMTSVRAA